MARAVNTAIDSLNFFVESRNAGNIVNVAATATGSFASQDLTNTQQRGGMFFFTVASVTVNSATVQFSILAKDVSASVYFPYIKVSVDGLTPTTTQGTILLYVGAVPQAGIVDPSVTTIGMPLPNVFQVVTSLSITTSASMSGTTSYKVDYSKVM